MTETRFLLRNIARRPIERHDGGAVTVIPADAAIEVDDIDDAHAALIERGLMTVHPAPTAPPGAPAAASLRLRRKTSQVPAKAKTPTKTSRRKGEGA